MISITVLVFLTFACLSNVSGRVPPRGPFDSKIVGGQPITDIRTRPYHASIEMLYINSQICSAAIISNRWVVTSGHCVALLIPEDVQIRVGTVRNGYGGDVYEVAQLVQHPFFEQVWWTSVDYDVGAIQTVSEMVFSLDVRPVALPARDSELPVGTPATVSGWGAISSEDDAIRPRTLQIGSVQVESRPACNITQQYIGNITSRMICAGDVGQDACIGDNGGPLTVGNTTYGVVSWGIGCGIGKFLSVFTNLANAEIRDFITEMTGI